MTPPLSATRGIGATAVLRSILPEVAHPIFVAITLLGSVPLVVALATLLYWFETRDGGAFALAAVLGAVGLTVALKAAFGLPRPPSARWLIEADGYGFPSGHAIAATVGWGVSAVIVSRWRRRDRFVVAGVVSAAVGLSRVVLGVHYAVDVVAGVAVGAAFLGALVWLDDVDRAFGAAVVLSVGAAVATSGGRDAMLLLGATTGCWFAWRRLDVPTDPWRREHVRWAVGGTLLVAGLVLVGYVGRFSPPVEVAFGLAGGSLLVGLPWLAARRGA